MRLEARAPLRVYGAAVSYYTGKPEGYLRDEEIPYEYVPLLPPVQVRLRREVGNAQVPAIELPDDRVPVCGRRVHYDDAP